MDIPKEMIREIANIHIFAIDGIGVAPVKARIEIGGPDDAMIIKQSLLHIIRTLDETAGKNFKGKFEEELHRP